MLTIRCGHCQKRYLVGTRSIVSLSHTTDGPVGYVRCPEGHITATDFGRGSIDRPPAKPSPTPAAEAA